jgi:hypothetical protein
MTLTAVWNAYAFHLIEVLPQGSKFNAGDDVSHILSSVPEILAPHQDGPIKPFMLQADNARPHCASMFTLLLDHNSLRQALHPPDSPDLAPQTAGFSRI